MSNAKKNLKTGAKRRYLGALPISEQTVDLLYILAKRGIHGRTAEEVAARIIDAHLVQVVTEAERDKKGQWR